MYYRYWLHEDVRPAHFGIRNERYKLAYFYGQPLDMTHVNKTPTKSGWEFNDLQEDPNEDHNAYQDEKYSDIIKEMKQEIVTQRKQFEDTDDKYPELLKQLKAEGIQ
jgi:hypothetical protein